MNTSAKQSESSSAWAAWLICALGCLALLIAVRLTFDLGALPVKWDEKYVKPVLDAIFASRWSMPSLIDYDDTKGPVFFWLYAAFGEVFGRDPGSMRWLSIICTAMWAVALVGLLGREERRPSQLAAVMALALTLPYAMVMSQLIMSEPSFLLGCAIMAVLAVRCLASERPRLRRIDGPIVFGILFAILLHHRIHVVALAGAIVLLAAQRDRWKSWPWFAAGLAAGLSRLPLYLRWGGLVGESFQHRYSVGLRLDSLVYLSAALLPTIGLVLLVGLMRRRELGRRTMGVIVIVGGFGAGLAAMAPPALSSDPQALNFAGPVASLLRPVADWPILLNGLFAALSALGAMCLACLVALTWRQTDGASSMVRLGSRLACLTIVFGWLLSAFAGGDVYDRYLIAFTFLWPVLCMRLFPWPLLMAQVLWQAAMSAQQVVTYLHAP